MRPSVSVVIVSYRSREPLRRCLESLRACARETELETIVVDNASNDGTVDWLRAAHPEVQVIANAENRGFTGGVNQGLARSRGEALLVLNPDCEVPPAALTRLLGALASHPEAAAVAPALQDGRGAAARSCGRFPNLWTLFCDHLGLARAFPESRWLGWYKYGGVPLDSLGTVDWASGAALLIPRRAYQQVGGLDEGLFMYMEEVDWCRRAARLGLRVRYVPQARILHLGQRSSRQAPAESYLHNLRSRVYYFRKHHGPPAALAAKGILMAGLAAKWLASRVARAHRETARVYAAGLETVWVAAWR